MGDKSLLGFFNEREKTDDNGVTAIEFIPLISLQLNPHDLKAASDSLKAEIQRNSQCVYSVESNNNDLNKTKESAMMYVWAKRGGDLFDLLNYQAEEGPLLDSSDPGVQLNTSGPVMQNVQI